MVGFPKDFSLDNFARAYVYEALKLAGKDNSRRRIKLGSFDSSLRINLSEQFEISGDAVNYLHHPFHWKFFDDPNNGSVLEYIQSKAPGGKDSVKLKRDYDHGNIRRVANRIAESILSEHRPYLDARIKSFNPQEVF